MQTDNMNRFSHSNLIVKVLNANKLKPISLKSLYEFIVQEHTPNGVIIGQIEPLDLDQVRINKVFSYI